MTRLELIAPPGRDIARGVTPLGPPPQEGERSPQIQHYLQIALRYRLMVAAIVAASIIAGLTLTLLITPKYSATSLIEIARESGKILNVEGVEREARGVDQEFYQTQYGLLESKSLATRVATKLRLAEDPNFFRTLGDIPDRPAYQMVGSRFTPAGRAERLDDVTRVLLATIKVDPVRGSSLVKIVFTTPSPELSAKLANSWSQNFIELNLERRYDATSYARSFLEKRLAELRNRLEETERQLVRYAGEQQVINIPTVGDNGSRTGAERSVAAETLALLNEELAKATADRIRAASRLRGGTAQEAVENLGIQNIRERRADVAAELAKLSAQFEADYPPLQQLRAQLDQLDRSVAREESRVVSALQTRYQEALARETQLQARLNAAKTDLLDQRQRSVQYNILLRDVDTNRALYDGLLQRYKEIGVAGGIGVNNISIIDPAKVPDVPSSPRILLNLAVATLFGLLAAAAAALVRDHLSDTVGDSSEVERKLGTPLIGLIPNIQNLAVRNEVADRKSPFVEAVLATQANLAMATQHGLPRSLSITSTRPGEGKSSTALALAVSIGRSGKRVILIDADMRRPSLHRSLDRPLDDGLSTYLSGQTGHEELVQPSGFANLDCMLAGKIPPNAADLLSGSMLTELIERLLGQYDHVIVDGPPVIGLADAPLIGNQVEGVVFVIESQGMRARAIRIAMDRLRMTGAAILGAVLTRFDAKASGYSYEYGYTYQYRYEESA